MDPSFRLLQFVTFPTHISNLRTAMKQFERTPLTNAEQEAAGTPYVPETNPVKDWGDSMSSITQAVGHLEESVPNGQIERTAHNLLQLEANVAHLRKFLEIRGAVAVVEPVTLTAQVEVASTESIPLKLWAAATNIDLEALMRDAETDVALKRMVDNYVTNKGTAEA